MVLGGDGLADPLPGAVALTADRLAGYSPDEGSVRRVLALARVDARRIPISGHAANTWWAACVEAAHQGRLRELVEVALEEYPLDDWLQAIHGQLLLTDEQEAHAKTQRRKEDGEV